jgi:hypothetical protein
MQPNMPPLRTFYDCPQVALVALATALLKPGITRQQNLMDYAPIRIVEPVLG